MNAVELFGGSFSMSERGAIMPVTRSLIPSGVGWNAPAHPHRFEIPIQGGQRVSFFRRGGSEDEQLAAVALDDDVAGGGVGIAGEEAFAVGAARRCGRIEHVPVDPPAR